MQFELFYRNRSKDRAKSQVRISCYYQRKYRYFDTGVWLLPDEWDKDNNNVSKKHSNYREIYKLLTEKLHTMQDYAYKYENSGRVFDFRALEIYLNGSDDITFYEYAKKKIQEEPNLAELSRAKYNYNNETIVQLVGLLVLNKIDENSILLIDKKLREKFTDSTTARFHVFIAKYLKKAVKDKIIRENPYQFVELKKYRDETKTAMHTMAELDAIAALDLKGTMALIRDRYLFSCYTGLRISDNMALLKSQIHETGGELVADLHTIKGYGHDIILPLSLMFDGRPADIARRYMTSHSEPTLFPRVSQEYIRTVLKVIADMIETNKNLHFHVARHTCASLLADISSNPYLIQYVLGHKDIKTSMTYIHRSPETVKKQFRILTDWKEKAR